MTINQVTDQKPNNKAKIRCQVNVTTEQKKNETGS